LKELGIIKLEMEWGIRAIRYEKSCRENGKSRLVRVCWEEKDKTEITGGKGKDLYSIEREKFYNSNGWGLGAIRELRSKGVDLETIVKERVLVDRK